MLPREQHLYHYHILKDDLNMRVRRLIKMLKPKGVQIIVPLYFNKILMCFIL